MDIDILPMGYLFYEVESRRGWEQKVWGGGGRQGVAIVLRHENYIDVIYKVDQWYIPLQYIGRAFICASLQPLQGRFAGLYYSETGFHIGMDCNFVGLWRRQNCK
jgi:hypothetical protein